MKNLPVIPDVAMKIIGMAEDGLDMSFGELESIIKMDPVLSAKILKVANSALYARQKEITNLKMAISLIGFKTIKSLVLLISASNLFARYQKSKFYGLYWRHSLFTAFTAKNIVLQSPRKDWGEQVFLTGLFHDIGQIALYNMDPERYEALLVRREKENLRTRELERETFGAAHSEIGAEILSRWNFPPIFVDTAREHGADSISSPYKSLVAAVSAADILSREFEGFPLPPEKEPALLSLTEIAGLPREYLDYLRTSFIKTLEEDGLYRESRALFKIH
jgi:putative nucleotidyltransferase with HDIG domain